MLMRETQVYTGTLWQFGVENNGLVVQRGEASVVEATSYIIQLI